MWELLSLVTHVPKDSRNAWVKNNLLIIKSKKLYKSRRLLSIGQVRANKQLLSFRMSALYINMQFKIHLRSTPLTSENNQSINLLTLSKNKIIKEPLETHY